MSNHAVKHALEPSELFSELKSTPSAPDSTNSAPTNNGVNYTTELEQLREKVKAQEKQIQSLYDELDEEREAGTSAINETMEMIRRLNNEKATLQLEARKVTHVAELTVHHKKESDDIKDSKIADLEAQIEAYREHMKRHGIEPDRESEYESEHESATNSELTNNGVDYTTELDQLREKVKAQEKQIQSIYDELDKEREAATSAANEAMAMISGLNYEKAAVQMEAQNMMQAAEQLREKVKAQEKKIQSLYDELDKEREAATSVANEAMAMISGLNYEKADLEAQTEYESDHGSAIVESDNSDVDATRPESNAPKFSVFGVFKEWLSNLFFQRGEPSSLSQSRSLLGKRR